MRADQLGFLGDRDDIASERDLHCDSLIIVDDARTFERIDDIRGS